MLYRCILGPSRFHIEWTNQRSYEDCDLPADYMPAKVGLDPFLGCLGWWPPTERREHPRWNDQAYVICDVVRDPEYRLLDPVPVNAHGRLCWRFGIARRDVLWFDVDVEGVLVARELYSPTTRHLKERYVLGGYERDDAGLPTPRWFQSTLFDDDPRWPDRRGVVRRVVHGYIRQIAVNRASDGRHFLPNRRPGDIKVNREDGSFTQTVPGGSGYLDAVEEWIAEQARYGRPRLPSEAHHEVMAALLTAAGVAISWRLCRLLIRRRPAASRSSAAMK